MSNSVSDLAISLALCAGYGCSAACAKPIDAKFQDNFSFSLFNNVGTETIFQFKIDTEIIVGEDTLKKGQTTNFDYTQTYITTTDPTVLGFTRGRPELVPANLFTPGATIGYLERLYPIHFEHDLFVDCCVRFSGLSSATLKTNSPASGGINQITIGPVGIGGSGTTTGDTAYNFHQTPTKTFLDWTTTSERGGLFFNGGSINFKGELMATEGSGSASLTTSNDMWLSGVSTVFPLSIFTNDVNYSMQHVSHEVTLNCIPEPNSALILLSGIALATYIFISNRKYRL